MNLVWYIYDTNTQNAHAYAIELITSLISAKNVRNRKVLFFTEHFERLAHELKKHNLIHHCYKTHEHLKYHPDSHLLSKVDIMHQAYHEYKTILFIDTDIIFQRFPTSIHTKDQKSFCFTSYGVNENQYDQPVLNYHPGLKTIKLKKNNLFVDYDPKGLTCSCFVLFIKNQLTEHFLDIAVQIANENHDQPQVDNDEIIWQAAIRHLKLDIKEHTWDCGYFNNYQNYYFVHSLPAEQNIFQAQIMNEPLFRTIFSNTFGTQPNVNHFDLSNIQKQLKSIIKIRDNVNVQKYI